MNDERDIEKQLRDYAGQRRKDAGEPRPVHPATRNLLQSEVGRLRAEWRSRHSRFSWSQFLFGSWQRVAGSLTAGAAIFVFGFVLFHEPAREEQLLAKNAAPQEKDMSAFNELAKKQELGPGAEGFAKTAGENRTNAAAATALSTAPALALSLDQSTAARPVAAPPAIQTAAPPATTTPQPAQPLLASADLAGQKRFADQADVVTRSREVFGGVTQEFSRIIQPALPARPAEGGPAGVLDSFRVEQNGDQFRVVDRDGSVYTGSVALAGTPAAASLLASAKPAGLDALAKESEAGKLREQAATGEVAVNQPAARTETRAMPQPTGTASVSGAAPVAGYLFRVSGTNLSLNQPVEFTGNFVADAEPGVVGQYRQIGGGGGGGGAGADASGGGAPRGGRRGAGGGARGGAATAVTNATAANTTATDAITNVARSSAVVAEPAAEAQRYFRIQGEATVGGSRMEINAQTAPK